MKNERSIIELEHISQQETTPIQSKKGDATLVATIRRISFLIFQTFFSEKNLEKLCNAPEKGKLASSYFSKIILLIS